MKIAIEISIQVEVFWIVTLYSVVAAY